MKAQSLYRKAQSLEKNWLKTGTDGSAITNPQFSSHSGRVGISVLASVSDYSKHSIARAGW